LSGLEHLADSLRTVRESTIRRRITMRKTLSAIIASLVLVLAAAGPAAADRPRLGVHGTQGRCHNLPGIEVPGGEHGAYVVYQLIDRCVKIRP
jgi:hypothetical protein